MLRLLRHSASPEEPRVLWRRKTSDHKIVGLGLWHWDEGCNWEHEEGQPKETSSTREGFLEEEDEDEGWPSRIGSSTGEGTKV